MELTLLGLAMPGVLHQLRQLLKKQGFIVQTMPTANPIIIAYKKGGWFRSPKQLIIEIISEQSNITKLAITAIITDKTNKRHVEEIVEENFVTKLNNVFKKATQKPHGI